MGEWVRAWADGWQAVWLVEARGAAESREAAERREAAARAARAKALVLRGPRPPARLALSGQTLRARSRLYRS